MNKLHMFAVVALVSGCASTGPYTGMRTVECNRDQQCEKLAKLVCDTDNFRVRTKFDRTIVRKRADYGNADSAGDVVGGFGGAAGGGMLDEELPRWKWEVECNPAAPEEIETVRYVPGELTPEQRARIAAQRAVNKAESMRDVCAVKYDDIREKELELARQFYEDPSLSCPYR